MSTAAVVFLMTVFFQFIIYVYGVGGLGCACDHIGNFQGGANTDFGDVGGWQVLSDAFIFLIPVLYTVFQVIFQGSGSASNQTNTLQDRENTDFGDVGWWQGLSDAFIFLIPVLYTALQVIYQGKSESLFVTHQTNMWISIIATFIFAFTFVATKKAIHLKTAYFIVIKHIAFFSGALSTLSTLSVVLPFKFALIFFVIWSLTFTFFTLKLIYCPFNLLTNWTKSLCDKFKKLLSDFVKSFHDKFNKLNTDTTPALQHPTDSLV